jgi:hypothetical protein
MQELNAARDDLGDVIFGLGDLEDDLRAVGFGPLADRVRACAMFAKRADRRLKRGVSERVEQDLRDARESSAEMLKFAFLHALGEPIKESDE